jgi:uncharacterized membrane protein YraQ (UPF0718 family)
MTTITATFDAFRARLPKIGGAWVAILVVLALMAAFDPGRLGEHIRFAAGALGNTAPFILFAVLAVATLKATGAESLIAKAFVGRETRMIVLAALAGGLSPFCSCEVIPFIAALLALGAPLSAVMAFWLSSPLMDPPMFLITAGALGLPFAVAKTVAAVALGLFGGFGVRALAPSGLFADPLKPRKAAGCSSCCGPAQPFSGAPVWRFWEEPKRRETFRDEALENGLFLLKWLTLAYVLEAAMIAYVPADWIGAALGGDGVQPIVLGALLGGPAYLNGYAAAPLVAGLLEQGMSPGAAMSFVLAGGVSSIPAAVAVWALVKPRIFASYLGFAFVGSVIAGGIWATIAGL